VRNLFLLHKQRHDTRYATGSIPWMTLYIFIEEISCANQFFLGGKRNQAVLKAPDIKVDGHFLVAEVKVTVSLVSYPVLWACGNIRVVAFEVYSR